MLHAAGIPLPGGIHVHGYWQMDDRKVSKSLGNLIDPLAMRERYGFAPFRYFLLREMSFGLDGTFSEEAMIERANAHLSNALGNLLSRTLNMTDRYCDGAVPAPDATGEAEETVRRAASEAALAVDRHLLAFEPHLALEALFRLVDATNRYVDRGEPWKAAKDPAREGEVRTTLYTCCQALRAIALLLGPFLPDAAETMLERLGAAGALATADLPADAAAWDALAPGTPTTKGASLFPRLERVVDE